MREPAIYGHVPISRVLVGKRHRKLDPDKVEALADSMKAISLQQPITVYYGEAGQVHLVAGYHRLEAAKRLGWEKIPCIVVTMEEMDRDLWEIDENLCRAELSTAEKREHVNRREALWERQQQKEAETKNGTRCPIKRGPGRPKGFASVTAEQTGRSKRTINRLRAKPEAKAKPTTKPKVETSVETGVDAARQLYLDVCADSVVDLDAEQDIIIDALREIAGKRAGAGGLSK
jgi:hypothetical protein